jgi:hypothetical protein
MITVCRICKIQFQAEKSVTICEDCIKSIIGAVVSNDECVIQLGKKIFELPAQTFGVGGTGSVANFFRREINQVSK